MDWRVAAGGVTLTGEESVPLGDRRPHLPVGEVAAPRRCGRGLRGLRHLDRHHRSEAGRRGGARDRRAHAPDHRDGAGRRRHHRRSRRHHRVEPAGRTDFRLAARRGARPFAGRHHRAACSIARRTAAAWRAIWRPAKASVLNTRLELSALHRDGHEFPIELAITPLETGKAISFSAFVRDITDRKRMEQALVESRQHYRALAESLPHLVWTCRPDGYCDYLSRQWVDYTGRPADEQLGFGWAEHVHPDDRERVQAEWEAATLRGDLFDVEFRIRRADGVYRWFRTRALPLRDGERHGRQVVRLEHRLRRLQAVGAPAARPGGAAQPPRSADPGDRRAAGPPEHPPGRRPATRGPAARRFLVRLPLRPRRRHADASRTSAPRARRWPRNWR